MAKVPYSKDEVLSRFDEHGAVTWMDGITYTSTRQAPDGTTVENKNETNDRAALELALEMSDPSLFEPAPQSVQTSAVLEAIQDTSLLDAVRDAHAQTLEAVRETAQLTVNQAQTELDSVKRELAQAKADLEKAKKNAKTTEAKPAASETAPPASSGLPDPAPAQSPQGNG